MDWLEVLLVPLWVAIWLAAWFAPIGVVMAFGVAYHEAMKSHEFALRMIHGLAVIILLMAMIWLAPYLGSSEID